MGKKYFVVNIGSASKKYALYENGASALFAHFESENGAFIVTISAGEPRAEEKRTIGEPEYTNAAEYILRELVSRGMLVSSSDIAALGLRIVSPGAYFSEHRIIDADYVARLQAARSEEPLHLGATLDELGRLTQVFGASLIVGISDSAFHASMPERARVYALPEAARTGLDIARFGYHGLSLASIVRKLGAIAGSVPERVIVCHLGSGSSIVALKHGVSVDTSMGFSPLEGVPMATRVGDIDAGALIRLARPRAGYAGLEPDALEKYLYTQCGLLGLSGTTADMRELIELEKKGDARAHLAIDVLTYRVKKYIGAFASALGGLDMLVFSATIGERSSIIRSRVCEGLEYLGLSIDGAKNAALSEHDGMFNADGSRVSAAVITTDEAGEMASILERFAR